MSTATKYPDSVRNGDYMVRSAGGTSRRLEFTMNTSHSLDVCDYSGSITGEQGKPAGVTCTYCVEDSDDKDYNDFCVTAAKRRRQR